MPISPIPLFMPFFLRQAFPKMGFAVAAEKQQERKRAQKQPADSRDYRVNDLSGLGKIVFHGEEHPYRHGEHHGWKLSGRRHHARAGADVWLYRGQASGRASVVW